jgi:hypothetical protein
MKLSLKNNQGQKNFKKSQRTLKNIIALLITGTQDIFRGFQGNSVAAVGTQFSRMCCTSNLFLGEFSSVACFESFNMSS